MWSESQRETKRRRLNPLWRKAPFALVRHPSLFLAIACGAGLVALAAASSPFFVTAAGNAALENKLAEITAFGAGIHAVNQDYIGRDFGEGGDFADEETLGSELARVPFVREPIVAAVTAAVTVERPGHTPVEPASMSVRLVARTGVLARVEKLAGRDGSGVWIADTVARNFRLRPGDEFELVGHSQLPSAAPKVHRVRVRVDGIYRALWKEPITGYWVNWENEVYPPDPDAGPPPTFAIAHPTQIESLYRALGGGRVERIVEFPVETSKLTLDDARRLDETFRSIQAGFECRPQRYFVEPGCRSITSSLDAAIIEAETTVASVTPLATLLASAGTIVALAVVAAAGAYAVARRRTEARLLFARGESAVAFAPRIAVEAFLPTLVGGLTGFLLGFALVALVGGGGTIDREGVQAAAVAAATRLPVGLFLLAAVVAFSFVREEDRGLGADRRLARIPWELPLLAIAGYLAWRVRSGGGIEGGEGADVARPSLAVFLFPLFLVAGSAGLAARGLRRLMRTLGPRASGLPTPLYLALRRLGAAQGLVTLLVVACAVALGAFFYAQTLVASLDRSMRTKAHVGVGSDVQGTINRDQTLPPTFPFPITKVTLEFEGAAVASEGSALRQLDLMAIDPATFARAAYWEPRWGPLPHLMRKLDAAAGERLPVIVAGAEIRPEALVIENGVVPIRIIDTVPAFPGMTARRPLVVTSSAALAEAAVRADIANPLQQFTATALVWAKGPTRAVVKELRGSPLNPYYMRTAESVLREPDIAAERRSFSFLRALGLAAGLLAVIGLVLYLQARQRSRVVASALSRRMGLRAFSESVSLSLELLAVLLIAYAVGASASIAGARLVVEHVDPLPQFAPSLVFQAPVLRVVAVGGVLLAVAAIGGLLARRMADRGDFAEVMRLGS